MNIIYIYSPQENLADAGEQQQIKDILLDNFRKTRPKFRVLKKFILTSKTNLETIFQEALFLANEKEAQLVINSFDPFQRNYQCIKLLHESKTPFIFLDFSNLNNKTLSYHLEYLTYFKKRQGQKISNTIKKRKSQGKKQGLQNVEPEKRKDISAIANHARKISKYNDPDFKKLLFKITKLKVEKKLSYQKIADYLNAEGTKTQKNKSFHSKTVDRFFKIAEKLNDAFNENDLSPVLVDYSSGVRSESESESESKSESKSKSKSKSKIKQLEFKGIVDKAKIDNIIKLEFTKIKYPIEITIIDKYNVPKFIRKYDDISDHTINISLEEIIDFYPGLYYIDIRSKNSKWKAFTCSFYYKEEVSTVKIFQT